MKSRAALLILLSAKLFGEYGCMDTSYHKAKLNDPKDYYFVKGVDGGPCSCPCSKHCAQYRCSLRHGRCPVCGHYRVPRPYSITRGQCKSDELTPNMDKTKWPKLFGSSKTHQKREH